MTQEERNAKTADALQELVNLAQKQMEYVQRLEAAIEKHEKAIGLLLKEVKELKDAKNKVTIYKP